MKKSGGLVRGRGANHLQRAQRDYFVRGSLGFAVFFCLSCNTHRVRLESASLFMPEPTVAAESTLILIDSDSVVAEMLKANDVRRVDPQGLLLLLLRSCHGGGEIVCCQK
jgi:hypothetical protein